MLNVETRYEHITLNQDKVPVVQGTSTKVVEIVVEQMAYGWSPEEIHFQHPYLSLGQIHSALAYYWDHKAELDGDIERRLSQMDQLKQATQPSALVTRLKSGLL